ncbi:MAG: histidinol dehydrogenase, partial [Atribacterota bacterium]
MSSLPILLKPLPDEKAAEMELGIGRKTFYRELQKVEEDVRDIIEKVMEGGDSALLELTERFDHCRLSQIAVPEMEFQKSWDDVDPVFKRSIEVITAQIREFHSNQGQHSWWTFRGPSLLGEIVNPIDSIATYIPGGRAAYTSSVMMTVIPAQIAGVKHIQILTPPDSSGRVKREVLATAHFLGIHTVYRVGGAQAIAACTFGTETVPRVNKVVGPGNIYVTVAKKLLSGLVGIDSLAGPSEVLIIADETARPDWIALDLLAQAEHDPLSRAILLSQREDVLLAVKKVLEREIQNHPLSFEKKFPISLFQVENLDLAFRI